MSHIKKLEDFKFVKSKKDLLNLYGGEEGGFYELDSETYMIKEMTLESTINEYIGSHIVKLIIGDNAPTVSLVKDINGKVYIASKFITNFKTLYQFLKDHNLPEGCFPYGCISNDDGSIKTLKYNEEVYEESLLAPIVHNYEALLVAMALIYYNDPHDNNKGVRINNGIIEAALVDYSKVFNTKDYRNSQDYVQSYDLEKTLVALKKVASLKLEEILESLFVDIRECYQDVQIDPLDLSISQIEENIKSTILRKQVLLSHDINIFTFINLYINNDQEKLTKLIPQIKEAILAKEDLPYNAREAELQLFKLIHGNSQFSWVHEALLKKELLIKITFETKESYFFQLELDKIITESQELISDNGLTGNIKEAVVYNKTEEFKQLFSPKENSDSEYTFNYYIDELRSAFNEAIKYNRVEIFEEFLPFFEQSKLYEILEREIFLTIAEYHRYDMFEKTLPHYKYSISSLVDDVLNYLISDEQYSIFCKLLPKSIEESLGDLEESLGDLKEQVSTYDQTEFVNKINLAIDNALISEDLDYIGIETNCLAIFD